MCCPSLFCYFSEDRKMEEERSWSSLPSEIQSIILEYLPVTSLIVCSAVSKEWTKLSRSNAIWKGYYLRDIVPTPSSDEEVEDLPEVWVQRYKDKATAPRWDSNYTDPALLLSADRCSFRRDNGKGLFPRAFSVVILPPSSQRWFKLDCGGGSTEVAVFGAPALSLLDKNLAEISRDHWYGNFRAMQYECCVASGLAQKLLLKYGTFPELSQTFEKEVPPEAINRDGFECVILLDSDKKRTTFFLKHGKWWRAEVPLLSDHLFLGFMTGCPMTKGTISSVPTETRSALEKLPVDATLP